MVSPNKPTPQRKKTSLTNILTRAGKISHNLPLATHFVSDLIIIIMREGDTQLP